MCIRTQPQKTRNSRIQSLLYFSEIFVTFYAEYENRTRVSTLGRSRSTTIPIPQNILNLSQLLCRCEGEARGNPEDLSQYSGLLRSARNDKLKSEKFCYRIFYLFKSRFFRNRRFHNTVSFIHNYQDLFARLCHLKFSS